VSGLFNFAYELAYLLFPPLMRSKASALGNGIGRIMSASSPLLVRVSQPMIFELFIAGSFLGLLKIVTFPDKHFMKGFGGEKDF